MSTTATTTIPTGTWNLDPVHSSIGFSVKHHVVANFRGHFDDVSAHLESTDAGASLEGVAKVASIVVKDENLQGHLLSPDFFDAERNPEITYRASDIEISDGGAVTARGELTVKGTTKPVEATGTIAGPGPGMDGSERIGLELTAIVDRTAFGLEWNAPLATGGFVLANDVKLHVELELVKA